jgi:ribosomal protein L7/L12
LKKVVKRQRTILGVVMREAQRKIEAPECVFQAIADGISG